MKVIVLADTHIAGSGVDRLPQQAWDLVARADVVLHAGDVTAAPFLAELQSLAQVHAVFGNNDGALTGVLAERVELDLDGVRVGMVHDSGPRRGRETRMRRAFPECEVVVFGHSHIPWNAYGVDGQLLFNPGSATQRRRQPHRTLGVLDLASGVVRARVVTLP